MRNVRETLAHWKWCVWEGALHFLATFPQGLLIQSCGGMGGTPVLCTGSGPLTHV